MRRSILVLVMVIFVDCERIEIYKDEYASVYFGLTIWWREKQGSQGAHYTLSCTQPIIIHVEHCRLQIMQDIHAEHYCTALGFAL